MNCGKKLVISSRRRNFDNLTANHSPSQLLDDNKLSQTTTKKTDDQWNFKCFIGATQMVLGSCYPL